MNAFVILVYVVNFLFMWIHFLGPKKYEFLALFGKRVNQINPGLKLIYLFVKQTQQSDFDHDSEIQ